MRQRVVLLAVPLQKHTGRFGLATHGLELDMKAGEGFLPETVPWARGAACEEEPFKLKGVVGWVVGAGRRIVGTPGEALRRRPAAI
jgi:hypothetical protein